MPANVNTINSASSSRSKVDGDFYAQPLYLPEVEIPGKANHNVSFLADGKRQSVYAFDPTAASADPLWHVNLPIP
jgi:hypothetical protein